MELILIRGLPGSGKTTMAREIEGDDLYCLHLEADMYFEMKDGVYHFNPALIKNAHAWCQRQIKSAMAHGMPRCIVSNTFVKKWEMQPYLDMADEFNYNVKILEAKGDYQSVHDVPHDVIERMRANWEAI